MLILKVGKLKYLELYENDPVNLTFQYSDIEKIQSSVGSYSQSFRIPATQNNIDFFGTFFNVNEQGGFNTKRKQPAEMFFNTVPIASGFIQLRQVYIQKERYADFEITFFGDTVDLARTIGDQKLKDLDLSAFDHLLNYSNYTLARVGALFSGKVRYGLIDKGKNFSNIGNGQPITADQPLELADFTPCLRIREVVNAIFEDNDFVLDSDFFSDSALDNYLTPFYNGAESPQTSVYLDDYTMLVGLYVTLESFAISGASYYFPSTFVDTGSFWDTQAQYDTTTDILNTDYSAWFSVGMTGRINCGYGVGGNFRICLYNNTDGEVVWQSETVMIESGGTHSFIGDFVVQLYSSIDYKYAIWTDQPSSNFDLIAGEYADGFWNTSLRIYDMTEPFNGQTVSLSANAPDIKQMDYLTSLQKMFNLVFVADKLNPKKITIEPFKDYNSGGQIKDWTELLDYGKDVVIKPTTDIQAKEYEWTYSEGKDYVNKFYKDNADRIYGRYLIEDGENDFSTGSKKVQPKFGAFPLSPVQGTGLKIFKAIDEKGAAIKEPLCHVVYGKNISMNGIFIDDNGTLRTEADFYYIGHYSELNPDVGDIDLNFGGEIPTYPIEANPYDNLYNTYWREYVNQLYSTEARMLQAHFDLDVADISQFEFSDQIWIKDSYWRILSIDYSPNSKSTSKVKLIKILADVRACDWIPYSSNVNGVITFIDENGTTGAPTQECCERFGYVYISGVCYQSFNTPVAPADTYDPSIIVGEAINSEVGLRVFAQGANIIAPNNPYSYIGGNDITLEAGGRNILALGQWMDVAPIADIMATGSNVNAFVEGIHRGGGWWYDAIGTGSKGGAQMSVVPFIYEGDFDDTDEVELFIEGKNNNRLSIPNGSTMYCRFDIVVSTYNVAGGVPVDSQTLVFFDSFKKISNVASSHYATGTSPATVNIGTFGASNFILNVDTATDTTQHRLLMHNNGDTNTYKNRIVCYLTCLLASW
jgi:hypothetical protein